MTNGCSAPAREEGDARRAPLDRVGHPELVEQLGDVAVRREQVVVVALEPVAVADVERRRLPAEPGPALVDVDRVAGAREPVRCDEAADAGAEDRDPHCVPALADESAGCRRSGLGRLDVDALAHDVQRPVLDLVVDPADVLADDPDRDQLDPAEQQDDHDRGRHAARVDVRVARDDRQRDREEREEREGEAEQRRGLQRRVREARDRVEGEAQHPRGRELARAAGARRAPVGHRGLREADPDGHPAQEAVALGHREQRVERRAVHQPEVARVVRELDPRELGEQAVEPARAGELERASRPRATRARRRRRRRRGARRRASRRSARAGPGGRRRSSPRRRRARAPARR